MQCSPTISLFFSQYGIHTKPFLRLFNCLCNIRSLLFQVTVGPRKLTCFFKDLGFESCGTKVLTLRKYIQQIFLGKAQVVQSHGIARTLKKVLKFFKNNVCTLIHHQHVIYNQEEIGQSMRS